MNSEISTRHPEKADFDRIVEVIDQWWGGPVQTSAHPIFFYELGERALVAEKEGRIVGFLLGFLSNSQVRTGYVHLVGIDPEFRRRGVGALLYGEFIETCREAGCKKMKAISTRGNEESVRFHAALGWDSKEVDDYAGPGRKRVVFSRDLSAEHVT